MKDSEFIERLRSEFLSGLHSPRLSLTCGRARVHANNTISLRPVDLEHVSARLGEIKADVERSTPSSSRASTISLWDLDEEEYYQYCLTEETKWYNALVKDGGRPSHDVHLGRDIIQDPGPYREIISFWLPRAGSCSPDDWETFRAQLLIWEEFRKNQVDERREGRFPGYCRALKDYLEQHGIAQSFELHEEQNRQRKLATWMEFLYFENRKYDSRMKRVGCRQHDRAQTLSRLLCSHVLRPSENEEVLCHLNTFFQSQEEVVEAEKAVESARSNLNSVNRAQANQRPPPVEQDHSAARSQLAAATAVLEHATTRHALLIQLDWQNRLLESAQELVKDYDILLRWILQQVPLIESESKAALAAERSLHRAKGEKQSRKRSCVEESCEKLEIKRQRRLDGKCTAREGRAAGPTIPKISFAPQPRPLRSSLSHSTIPCSTTFPSRTLCTQRALSTAAKQKKSNVVAHGSIRKSQRGHYRVSAIRSSQALRRSSRTRRFPERFQ